MYVVDMSQSCQGSQPQINGKMAKASPHQDKTWSEMAKPSFPSGLCVDVDNMCKNVDHSFLTSLPHPGIYLWLED